MKNGHLEEGESIESFIGEIGVMEEQNLKTISEVVKLELDFATKVLHLYHDLPVDLSGEDTILGALFNDSSLGFTSSFHNLLRGHIGFAFAQARNALEAALYAGRIVEATDAEERKQRVLIYMEKDANLSEWKKFYSYLNMFGAFGAIQSSYDALCHGSHPSAGSQSMRVKFEGEVAFGMYFDNWPDDEAANIRNYRYSAGFLLGVHLSILSVYSSVFEGFFDKSEWEKQLEEVSDSFIEYIKKDFPQIELIKF